jgi:hypothetical protein
VDRPPFPCRDIIISCGGKFKKEVAGGGSFGINTEFAEDRTQSTQRRNRKMENRRLKKGGGSKFKVEELKATRRSESPHAASPDAES